MATLETEPKVPAPRDDDSEEVADKLSIAAAMWARGETADAVNWIRRAAESASDADADVRALELAKAAAELASAPPSTKGAMGVTAPTGTQPVRAPSESPAAKPSSTAVAAAAPKPPSRPAPKPSVRPPGGKLAPLPPLRPLGAASAHPPGPPPAARPSKKPSESTAGMPAVAADLRTEPSTEPRAELQTPHAPPVAEPVDHDETSVMPAAAAQQMMQAEALIARSEAPPAPAAHAAAHEPAHEPAHDDGDLRETMRRDLAPPPQEGPPPSSSGDDRLTAEPARLPLAIGMRVRLYATEGGAWVVPDAEGVDPAHGVAAILVPLDADDDLRSVFRR